MSRRPRRNHSAAFKAKVALAMGWTPPPRKGTEVSNWSFHKTSY